MPVEDHSVHQRTINRGEPYGCHNRKAFKSSYQAPARRYFADGKFVPGLEKVVFQNSRECRYDLSDKDIRCKGCKHRIRAAFQCQPATG